MKLKTYLSLMIIGMCSLLVSCQDDEGLSINQVPADLRADFESRFPGTNSSATEWEQEGNFWEAEFTENGVEVSVIYTLEFEWVRTEREGSVDDLTAGALASLENEFPGGTIDEAGTYIDSEGRSGQYAEVVFEGTEYEVFFNVDDAIAFIINDGEATDFEDDEDGSQGGNG